MAEARSERWGLGLSGGGFRASFFHIGVLRRLAELDLLGRLNVISTVSGGSIVGALYLMRLKERIEATTDGVLTTDDYLQITETLEKDLCEAVSFNLRTRLFALPSRNLAMLCTRFPLGRRMAELYDHRLYGPAGAPGLKLRELRITFTAKDPTARSIEAYNAAAAGRRARIPKLVLNATSLNSGKPFTFTAAEVGDPLLGFLRFDEAGLVVGYKRALAQGSVDQILAELEKVDDRQKQARADGGIQPEAPSRVARFRKHHVEWWMAANAALADRTANGEAAFARVRTAATADRWPLAAALWPDDPGRARAAARVLLTVSAGVLRKAKLAAWFYREGDGKRDQAEESREATAQRLREALEEIGAPVDQGLMEAMKADTEAVCDFLLDLYYLRSATAFSIDAAATLADLRMVDAVAASANFPPVFPPFVVKNLYDPETVDALGLTDGGVYDNQGTSALLEEECTHLVVSDAGGALEIAAPPPGRLTMMGRFVSVLMGNIREAQIADLRQRRASNKIAAECALPQSPDAVARPLVDTINRLRIRTRVSGLAFFHIASSVEDATHERAVPGALDPHPDAGEIAMLRTDLDVFAPEEIDALVYQGYQLCDRYVRGYLPAHVVHGLEARSPVAPRAAGASGRVERVLRAGASRVGRAVLAQSRAGKGLLASLLGIAAVAGLVLARGSLVWVGHALAQLAGLNDRGGGVPLIGGLLRGCARVWTALVHQPVVRLTIAAAIVAGIVWVPRRRVRRIAQVSGMATVIRRLRFRSNPLVELGVLGVLGLAEFRWQLLDRLWDLVGAHPAAVVSGLAVVVSLSVLLTRGTRRVLLRQFVWLLAAAPFLATLALTLYAWSSYAVMSPVGRRTRKRRPHSRRPIASDDGALLARPREAGRGNRNLVVGDEARLTGTRGT
jgi:predicted acylesterase/phospholipase RssA